MYNNINNFFHTCKEAKEHYLQMLQRNFANGKNLVF